MGERRDSQRIGGVGPLAEAANQKFNWLIPTRFPSRSLSFALLLASAAILCNTSVTNNILTEQLGKQDAVTGRHYFWFSPPVKQLLWLGWEKNICSRRAPRHQSIELPLFFCEGVYSIVDKPTSSTELVCGIATHHRAITNKLTDFSGKWLLLLCTNEQNRIIIVNVHCALCNEHNRQEHL